MQMYYNTEHPFENTNSHQINQGLRLLYLTISPPTSNLVRLHPRNETQTEIPSYNHWDSAHKTMSYFKITLIRSAIGLPRKTQGVLSALGLRKRMRTVFHPVSPQIAGHIMKVKELVAVSEVESALTKAEMRDSRRPEPGYYIEKQSTPALKEGL